MPRKRKRARGEGSRTQQDVYDENKPPEYTVGKDGKPKRVAEYWVWSGHDWATTPDGETKKVKLRGRKGETLREYEVRLGAKVAAIEGDQSATVKDLQAEIERLKAQMATMVAPAPPRDYPTIGELYDRFAESSAVKRQRDDGQRKKQKGLAENFLKIPLQAGVRSPLDFAPPKKRETVAALGAILGGGVLGETVARDLREAHLQALDTFLQQPRRGYRWRRAKVGGEYAKTLVEADHEAYGPRSFGHLLALLEQIYVWGMQSGQRGWSGIEANVPKEYVPDRSPEERVEPESETQEVEELVRVLDWLMAHDPPLCALLAVIASGERTNAARTLEWGQWDEELKGWHLVGQWKTIEGERKFRPLKNDHKKLLQLPRALERYALVCREWSPRWVVPTSRDEVGTHLSSSGQTKRWDKVRAALGISWAPYSAKHSVGTRIAEIHGVEVAAMTLGVSKQVAEKYYVRKEARARRGALSDVFGHDAPAELMDPLAEETAKG